MFHDVVRRLSGARVRFGRRSLAATAVALAFLVAAPLSALDVQPIIIDLLSAGRRAASIVTLRNTYSDSVPVEVTVHPIKVVDGQLQEMENEPADNLLVFPAQAIVPGGQTQAFRVQWVGDPEPAKSEHYYVTVAQLPVELTGDQNAIQVLHRFRVLVNVGAEDGKADLKVVATKIATSADGKPQPIVSITNQGNTYGYVGHDKMTITQTGRDGKQVFRQTYQPEQIQQYMGLGLVPSGETRILPIGIDLPQADGTISIDISSADTN